MKKELLSDVNMLQYVHDFEVHSFYLLSFFFLLLGRLQAL